MGETLDPSSLRLCSHHRDPRFAGSKSAAGELVMQHYSGAFTLRNLQH